MRLPIVLTSLALLLFGCASNALRHADHRTRVMVVASMHRYHQDHPTYDFATVYSLVRSQDPDYVGVEIRPEDIGADEVYLAKSYPPEMIALMKEYGTRAFGFDWLGNEIAGRPIPDNWWKEQSEVKRLERALSSDPAMQSGLDDELSKQQQELLKSATASSLTDGRYATLVRKRRQLLSKMVGSGKYLPFVKYTEDRERRIGDNIVRMIRSHPGKKFVLVMGADHHGFAVERLRKEFGSQIVIEPVP